MPCRSDCSSSRACWSWPSRGDSVPLRGLLDAGLALGRALELAARADAHVADDAHLLDLRAVVAALGELQDLDDLGAGASILALDLLLRRNRPPQHQQLAD